MTVEVASCTLAKLFSKQSIVSANNTEIHGEIAIPEFSALIVGLTCHKAVDKIF